MPRISLFPALAGLVLSFVLPAAAFSQDADPTPALIPQDSVELALQRFQALQQQVGTLQQEVMNTTPALQERQAAVSLLVEEAVYEIDATLQDEIADRMPRMQQEAEAAQAANDTVALQALQEEFVALRSRAEEAEAQALEQPEIQSQVEAFESALRAEMQARNPTVGGLMDELETLAGRLDATLGGD